MRSVSIRLYDLRMTTLYLGYAGENEHTNIIIDCKQAFDQYPNAVPALTVKNPNGESYPAVVAREGDIVTWVVTGSDLVYEGNGEIQLAFVQDGVIMKSFVGKTTINKSIEPTGTMPTPVENWIIQAEEILGSIPQSINEALEAAKESGEFDGVGISNIEKTGTSGLIDSYTITFTDGNTFIYEIKNGKDGTDGKDGKNGTDGVSPEVSVVQITGGHRVSITDASATNTFDVMDGAPGLPGPSGQGVPTGGQTGQILKKKSNSNYDTEWAEETGGNVQIDDTAGAGATNVTWSANKSAAELSSKYEKPVSGIPSTDLTSEVQTSLGKADTAYQKPSNGIPSTDLASGVIPDVSGKADKVVNATTGNFASFDSNGNLSDSGSKASDFITSHQDISGKADKVSSATDGNFAGLDSSGNLTDSGHKHSDYLTEHQDISGKADKVTSATNGNFAGLDSNGNLTDSGNKASDFIATSLKGANNGVAELDSGGKVPSSQLPSYVDDVVEYESLSAFPETGESGKIYVALDTNKSYRWSGTEYVAIASDLALGETSSTAYRGDRGAEAYAASVTNVESAPSSGSSNLITSGAVYTGLDSKANKTDTVLETTLSRGRKSNSTVGTGSFAFGNSVTASAQYTHAEGYSSTASGQYSHAEGNATTASGSNSHAEGFGTVAYGSNSHAEGYSTNSTSYGARGKADHAEGYYTFANSGSNSSYYGAHAEGKQTRATSNGAHAEGNSTTASGQGSHAEGNSTTASGQYSHAEGNSTTASGSYSHAEGSGSTATSQNSHAEGLNTSASGHYSHAEGLSTIASAYESHAEGWSTTASGVGSHSEGCYTSAYGAASHAQGAYTCAPSSGLNSLGVYNKIILVKPAGTITINSDAPEWNPNKDYYNGDVIKVLDNGTYIYYVCHADAKRKLFPPLDSINFYSSTAASWHRVDPLPSTVDPASVSEFNINTHYDINTYVKITDGNNVTYWQNHQPTCGTEAPHYTVTNYWHTQTEGSTYNYPAAYANEYVEIVGNGINGDRSNARALDFDGNERLKGTLYVNCNADSSGGTRVPHDVQVNGTSVVTSGVANVPMASSSVLGVAKTSTVYGTAMLPEGIIRLEQASSSNIKEGTQGYKPIVPERQHIATFYGLAKASGDTTQASSSNEVGTYTDSAKIAIQKMLGVYQAPWELIIDSTVTNSTEADIVIQVDSNGNPLQLTDLVLLFETPQQGTEAKKGDYGTIYFYYKNTNDFVSVAAGTWTQAANASANGTSVEIENKDDLIFVIPQISSQTGAQNYLRRGYKEGFTGAVQGIQIIQGFYVHKIKITAVTGTGHFKLFGKRKWT